MEERMRLRKDVEAGAFYLDEHHPGWFEKINLDTLDLSKQCRCVLGQLYRDYDRGLIEAKIADSVAPLFSNACALRAIRLGFFSFGTKKYDKLTNAWKRAILDRLNNPALTVEQILSAPMEGTEDSPSSSTRQALPVSEVVS
jgi:hypothetical protein